MKRPATAQPQVAAPASTAPAEEPQLSVADLNDVTVIAGVNLKVPVLSLCIDNDPL